MQTVFAFILRLILLAAGLAFAASLVVVLALVAALWGARYAWARLTGRPLQPFLVRIDPRAGFRRMYPGAAPGAPSRQGEPAANATRAIGDVTDVEAKPPRPT